MSSSGRRRLFVPPTPPTLTFIFCHRWYTQQNPPRARTYSWSRNLRPILDPQQRPGSAPLYGRFCYGLHTLPVLRDYPGGPLEAGLQLTQLTRGLTRAQAGGSLLVPAHNGFEAPPGAPQTSSRPYAEQKGEGADGDEGSEAETKDARHPSKVRPQSNTRPQHDGSENMKHDSARMDMTHHKSTQLT